MKFSKDIKRYTDYSGKPAIIMLLTQQGLWALLQYRFFNWIYNSKSPKIIKLPLLFVEVCHQKGMGMLTGITLPYATQIGKHLLHGKAVISTPISVQIEGFKQGENYLELSSRSAYKELPDCINDLQKNNKYIEMGQANLEWSSQYIHPKNYLSRVLEIVHSH
jgi:hypothetical protein